MSSPVTTTPPEPSTAGDGGGSGPGGRPAGRRWRGPALAVAVAALLAVGAVSLVWLGGDDGDDTTAGEPPTTVAPSTEPTAGPGTQGSATTAPADQPGAVVALAPFLSAAAAMDGQLHAAAEAINGAGPPWDEVTDEVAGAVQAADPAVVAATIPAGLPQDLLGAVILVYSDLASRRAAMQSFAYAGIVYDPDDVLLAELGNGHEAATRFEADLAAARSLAESSPPVVVAAPDSRAAAELLLLVQYVDKANIGCDSRGGGVVTELPTITWTGDSGGTIGTGPVAIEFQATLGPDGYHVEIMAC